MEIILLPLWAFVMILFLNVCILAHSLFTHTNLEYYDKPMRLLFASLFINGILFFGIIIYTFVEKVMV